MQNKTKQTKKPQEKREKADEDSTAEKLCC